MVGSAAGDLGKAATAEEGDKRPEEEQPEEELSKMEEENEERVESLGGETSPCHLRVLGLDSSLLILTR
jgi:hypothetical protein